jgi:hypothetical protein
MMFLNLCPAKYFCKAWLPLLLFVAVLSSSSIAQSPGGVSANLVLWLKADAGISTTTDSASVNTWTDNLFNRVLNGFNAPLYLSNSANYNPAVFYNQGSYHVLPAAVPILNSTVFVAGILMAGSSGDGYHDFWTTDDEADFPLRIKSGQLGHYGNGEQFVLYNWNRNEVSFAREHVTGNKDVTISKQGSPATTFPNLAIGTGGYYYLGKDASTPEGFGNVSETFIYNTADLLDADIQKIESYPALKYGLTLDKTAGGTAGNYILSDGTLAWDASSYQRDVIGIVRDNGSALLQKQSHTLDDSLRIFTGSLAAANGANTGVISNVLSALMIGNDGGLLKADLTVAKPAGIYARFGRTWKVINTRFSGNFSVEIKWDSAGAFNLHDIRLLVSGSSDFSNAAIYDSTSVGFSSGSIIVTGISNAIIPLNATRYITIGSASALTALPIKIAVFSVSVIDNNDVLISWQTNAEINYNYFSVQKSTDGSVWQDVAQVKGAGNNDLLHSYNVTDKNPYTGISWYRIKQTDLDGAYTLSDLREVAINKTEKDIILYPNPVSQQLIVKANADALKVFKIYNLAGEDITNAARIIEKSSSRMVLDLSVFPSGVYSIKMAGTFTGFVKQ